MKLNAKLRARTRRFDDFRVVLPRPSPVTASCIRSIHTTRADKVSLSASSHSSPASAQGPTEHAAPGAPAVSILSCLPLSQVLRTYFITSVSSSPVLLTTCFNSLTRMLNSRSVLTNVEKNPLLKILLRETFYKQFCSGENRAEVQQSLEQTRKIGYRGVILEYALEILNSDVRSSDAQKDINRWRDGLLATIDMTSPGDFVGLKWSGLGPHALQRLKEGKEPSPSMDAAMRAVCDAAEKNSVALLPAAEETTTTPTIDMWSLNLQRDYNRGKSRVVIYNTYQAYLKSTPAQLAKHLASARNEGYTLGIKLVRGAYLGTEPRYVVWPSIEATHSAYDSLASALLRQRYGGILEPLHGTGCDAFPPINLVLATHNAASVRKAQAIRKEQAQNREERIELAYAQLQGMADEVSCELLQAGRVQARDGKVADAPKAYKCTTWGSMTECLNYLIRRANENKDAASRTADTRAAMSAELGRRFWARLT